MTQGNGNLSVFRGPPLSEEPGLGALTLGGYLEEVCGRHGAREALAMPGTSGRIHYTYSDLWSHSQAAARALVGQNVSVDDLRAAAAAAGRPLKRRTTLYGDPSEQRATGCADLLLRAR